MSDERKVNALERHSVGGQLSRGLGVGSIIALTTGGILVAAYLGTRAADIPFTDLSRDPAATLGGVLDPDVCGNRSRIEAVLYRQRLDDLLKVRFGMHRRGGEPAVEPHHHDPIWIASDRLFDGE